MSATTRTLLQAADPRQSRDRRLFLALKAAIIANFTPDHWSDLATFTGSDEIVYGHSRLLRSLDFGDDDYPSNVGQVLSEITGHMDIDDLVNVVDDMIDVDSWIQQHQPQLYRELFAGGEAAALMELQAIASVADIPEINRHIARIRLAADSDPEQVIGSSKELLETVLDAINKDSGKPKPNKLPKLAKQVRDYLGLTDAPGGSAIAMVLSGLSQIVDGLAEIRNDHGTGHGRVDAIQLDTAAARLVADSASAQALYLLTVWRNQSRSNTDNTTA
jgi:hypothetical protein